MESNWQEHRLPTTRWSVIARAGGDCEVRAREAFEEVSRVYWMPLYALARFKRWSPEDAEDLVQGFLMKLPDSRFFENADPTRGKLRNYLRECFENHLRAEARRGGTIKRGGEQKFVSIDTETAELNLGSLEAPGMDLTSLYDKQWALALLRHVLGGVEETYRKRGEMEVFRALSPYLRFDGDGGDMGEIAGRLGKTAAALRQSLCRMRVRYKEAVIAEIRETVGNEEIAEEELGYLMGIFGG